MNLEQVNPFVETISPLPKRRDKTMRKGSWQISNNLGISFYYAYKGIAYAFLSQRNFRLQVLIGAVALSLGIWLNLNLERLVIIIFTISLVLTLELINTAVEASVDLAIGRKFHPLARIAKDCSAGAVLIASIVSLMVALILLLPPLLLQLGIS